MKKVFTDFTDDIKCIKLTGKGWNYIATFLLMLAGWYWLKYCDNGAFFQVTGCFAYLLAGGLWAAKTDWAKKLMEIIEGNQEYNDNWEE